MTGGDGRKMEAIPDWQVAGLTSKRTYIWGLCWRSQDEQISEPACRILQVCVEALTGISHIYGPDGLNTQFYLKTTSLGQPLGAGKARRTHIPSTGKEVRSLSLPESSSWVNRQSRLPNDLLQHPIWAGQFWFP